MTKPLVLIVGGTSRNGSEVAKLLLTTGKYAVRLSSRDPSKLAAFVAQGVEAVVVDSTFESMREALERVTSMYFIFPDLVGGAGDLLVQNLFQTLKEITSVTHIVYLSVMNAAPNSEDFEIAHKHYNNEQLLTQSGIPFTILRPTYFHENLIAYYADSIKRSGETQTGVGNGVWTSVAICDIAAVAMAALTNPSAHAGKIYNLREEVVTYDQVAEKISKAIGKKVTVVSLTPEEHFNLTKKSLSGLGLSASRFLFENVPAELIRLDKDKQENKFSVVTPDLEMVLVREGVLLDDFLADHADDFKVH